MEGKLDLQVYKEDETPKGLIASFKEKFFKVAKEEKESKIDLLLTMFEEKRITREEFLKLSSGIGDQKIVIESISIDNSVRVKTGTTWGGVFVGENNTSNWETEKRTQNNYDLDRLNRRR